MRDGIVLVSDVCDYTTIEDYYAGGGLFRWGHAWVLDVRVERHRDITIEVYGRLERAADDT